MTEAIPQFKYLLFFLMLFVGVPISSWAAFKYPKFERIIFFLSIFFTARMEDINFVSRESFRLTSRGFEVGMVDICVLVLLYLVLKRRKHYPVKLPPGSWLYFLYFLFSMLSMVNSSVLLFSWFEAFKMLRMYMFFFVIYNYVNSFEKLDEILIGSAIITIYIFIEVMIQKYIQGLFQSYGPFPHQNSLVMYSIVLGSLVFSYIMNKTKLKSQQFLFWMLIFSMISVNIIATLSRAGLVLYAVAIVIILNLSFISGLSAKKIGVSVMILLLGLGIMAKAWNTIQERFITAPTESANVRKELAFAATKMVNDKALGIGLNNFGVKINPPYDYGSHIPMNDPDDEEEQNGLVETIYLMIAAECGWHTMIIFLVFIFYYFFLNITHFFKLKGSPYQYFPIAMIGALLALYMESTLEWVLKQTNNFYQLMLIFALIAANKKLLAMQRRSPNKLNPTKAAIVNAK